MDEQWQLPEVSGCFAAYRQALTSEGKGVASLAGGGNRNTSQTNGPFELWLVHQPMGREACIFGAGSVSRRHLWYWCSPWGRWWPRSMGPCLRRERQSSPELTCPVGTGPEPPTAAPTTGSVGGTEMGRPIVGRSRA